VPVEEPSTASKADFCTAAKASYSITSFGDGTVDVIYCNGRNCEPPAVGEHDLHVGLKAPVVVLIYVNAK